MVVGPCEQLPHWNKVDGSDERYEVTREVLVGVELV
jgi:hypothetical protein